MVFLLHRQFEAVLSEISKEQWLFAKLCTGSWAWGALNHISSMNFFKDAIYVSDR